MKVDSISNGVVIDHITAGRALRIYELLNLETLDCSVAVIKNVNSKKMGKKDIIKKMRQSQIQKTNKNL